MSGKVKGGFMKSRSIDFNNGNDDVENLWNIK